MKFQHRCITTCRQHRFKRYFGNAVGNDFQRGDHVAILDQLVMLDTGQSDPFIDHIDCLQPVPVKAHDSAAHGIYIDAPCRCCRKTCRRRHQLRGKTVRCAVLINIACLQPCHNQRCLAGGPQPGDVISRQPCPLANTAVAKENGMRQDCPFAFVQRNRAEFHDQAPPRRSTVIISARMDTAISAGVFAPISRPAGPCRRCKSASLKPASCSRSHRAACVRRDPRHPI